MFFFDKCLFCGKSMTGKLFYHPSCFSPSRYKSRNIQSIIDPIINKNFYQMNRAQFLLDHDDLINLNLIKQTKLLIIQKQKKLVETDIVNLNAVEIFFLHKEIDWAYFSKSLNLSTKDLWKYFPYLKWGELSSLYSLAETTIIQWQEFIDFPRLQSKNITKNLMLRFHSKINWSIASVSPHIDKEIVKKFFKTYTLDWWHIFNKMDFSEYELEKYVNHSNFSWSLIALMRKPSLTTRLIRKYQNDLFKTTKDAGMLIKNYQVPSDVLDNHINVLDWGLIKEHQTNLEAWFIQKHYQDLLTETLPRHESVSNLLKNVSMMPALKRDKNDRYNKEYQVEMYSPGSPPSSTPTLEYFLPLPTDLTEGKLVYDVYYPIKNRKKLGLRHSKKYHRHVMTNPWVHYSMKRPVIAPSKQSLCRVLRKNKLGRKENRHDNFNEFLITNKLV